MRILLTSRSTEGHFHPLVPIAQAAVRAGHEVAFATQPPFVPMIERSGFRVFPAGAVLGTVENFPELRTLRGEARVALVLRRIWPAEAARMVSDLLGIFDAWRPDRYIPQTLVFPHCDVVICHAGSGSVMAALTHGLPLVLVPITADQPQNAARCAALGVARVLDWTTLDPTSASAAVRDVLEAAPYRQSAARLRAEMEALPGPEEAVTILEGLASGQDLALMGH